ncbi:TniB family NTP-binding protein [Bradyrhizobium sp. ERR14]|uniref:TniB family NTP-binding protein n=1 Tax=Bradyrhizobium sp. ERR14 TaxID=2663837 RepID=UPI002899E7B8|nr:TniB family NTP-binding protein [Bradyrhizobium sp. ERR14]
MLAPVCDIPRRDAWQVGPTNNGKTMIVEKFRRSHTPVAAIDAEDESLAYLYSRRRCRPVPMSGISLVQSSKDSAWRIHHCCAAELGDAADVEGGCADACDR